MASKKLYRYYSTQRPIGPGTIPSASLFTPVEVVNFDGRTWVEANRMMAWGYVDYEEKLPDAALETYELKPARNNPDVWARMCQLAERIGPVEAQKVKRESERLTWYASDYGCYAPTDFVSLEQLEERAALFDKVFASSQFSRVQG